MFKGACDLEETTNEAELLRERFRLLGATPENTVELVDEDREEISNKIDEL